jgi:peptide/nickel transport system substrate-binding protein
VRPSQRRIALWFWCGVIFLSASTACGGRQDSVPASRSVLTIGFPEAEVVGAELGLGQLITGFTLEGLTQLGADGRALPRVAEKWEWENNGLTLRLTLRQGVSFHDGTALTSQVAADVVQRMLARPGSRALYPFLADIKQVKPDGELELVLELTQPSAFLPEELEMPLTLGVGGQNVGTGPFRLVSRNDDRIVLESFDRYYLGAPQIDQVVIRPFDTLRIAWSSLLRGEVDMVTDVPAQAVAFVRNNDVEVVPFARRYQFMIVFNSGKPPFRSTTVRRALNIAVDRQRLITNVLENRGQPATGPIWPKHWAYDSAVQPFTFDPQGAVASLETAGFRLRESDNTTGGPPSRFRFTCLLPEDFSLWEQIGLEVQKQLYDAGVDMQFEVVPVQEFDARAREGKFEAMLVDLNSGPTLSRPYVFWASTKHFKGFNTFGYENAETEKLFQLLHTATNEATIRSATYRLQRALIDDPPALFLVWNERARAINRRFRITDEPGRDPLHTIWQWTENTDRPPISTQ